MSDPRPVLVVGDLLTDVLVLAGEHRSPRSDAHATVVQRGGGSAANVAAWLAWSGVPTVFAGRVGADPYGELACRVLTASGVTVRAVRDPARPTGTCVVLVEVGGDRDMFVDPGASGALDLADLPDPSGFGWVHLSGYPLLHPGSQAAAVGLLRAATAAGIPVSVDPASAAPLRALGAARFTELIAGVAAVFPNADEAAVLTGHVDPAAAAAALLPIADAVVVTLGADGARYADRWGGLVRTAAAVPPGPVLDPTGAGDAFVAGWLTCRLAGDDPARCLAGGARLGALAVTLTGGRPPATGIPVPPRATDTSVPPPTTGVSVDQATATDTEPLRTS